MMCLLFSQVTCVGHIIGAVVADSQLHAQRAAKAVKIQYEELKPIITIQVRPEPPERSVITVELNHIFVSFNRKPLLPSPSMNQSEPSRMETWKQALNKLITYWRVQQSAH